MHNSPSFTISGDRFLLDGAPLRVLSGALHYFRVVPGQWRDRLLKLRAMGLNTVETYVAWNLHEPRPGEFRFDGGLDLAAFVRLAQELGLYVIVRPGPYICAEWEFGGLPAWLLADPAMEVRCCYPPYLDAVRRFYAALLPQLLTLQVPHGGPILAMQVENEYGSYGSDSRYVEWVRALMVELGVETLLFTSDGATDHMLTHGTLPAVYKTANFGSRADGEFAKLREYQPDGPLMCMEFWNGWFDHWGEPHHTRDAADAAQALDEILASGASVNVYMFHGGTNFGFMNGANTDLDTRAYQPTVNSYDYDAPLSEAGEPTAKFYAFREVIAKYVDLPPLSLPPPAPILAPTAARFAGSAALADALPVLATAHRDIVPRAMESLGQDYGFLLYRTTVAHPPGKVTLSVERVHDRAQVFVNGVEAGVLARDGDGKLEIDLPAGPVTLDLLVENMGRVNYGPDLQDRKGLLGWVRLGINKLYHWTMFQLPLADLSRLEFAAAATAGPAFHRAVFDVAAPGDSFLSLPGWSKGVAWVNGFNLGRYWERGPQQALYVPAPLLRQGENELIVFELHGVRGGDAVLGWPVP
ncbi:glycoside hydrolase family 35 protein [Pseudoduganella albidiflava]|uniref:Beta-galactosidase n=1 Tax=Pseudoduganella albidiflava TaxID=321983 RepID=A0A411X070_9BURK|nr:beta-galactosidase family protein [Pseudoduganella albidiflava]QBI02342.1 beta-galactosidase [Pseudoduganella albidiflava]GGY43547.1 beta-galactosidase [Pseudoduganella albidiflava]